MLNASTQLELAADQRRHSWEIGKQTLPNHLHTTQVMALFGVSQARVLSWHNDGILEADIPPARGPRRTFRYPRSRVIAFARQNSLELNLEAAGFIDEAT